MENVVDYLPKINDELKKLNFRIKIILYVGIPLLILLPLLITQFSIIDFTTTGQIGDTIGGITAPVIGLISAFIIYFSFVAQIKANQIQIIAIQEAQKQIENQRNDDQKEKQVQFIETQLKLLRELWKEFQISTKINLVHMGAGKKLSKKFIESPIHLNRINNLLLQIDRFWNTLKQNENVYEELKQRYIFSDILLLLNDETKGLFLDLRDVLNEYNPEENKNAFTLVMIDKVYEIQLKINHIANKPDDQSEVIEILKSIDEFIKSA